MAELFFEPSCAYARWAHMHRCVKNSRKKSYLKDYKDYGAEIWYRDGP